MQGAGLCHGGARGRGDGYEARQPETGDGGQGHDRQVSNYQTGTAKYENYRLVGSFTHQN